MDRRRFLKLGAGAAGAAMMPSSLLALAEPRYSFAGQFAAGGIVAAGEPYLVGERGGVTICPVSSIIIIREIILADMRAGGPLARAVIRETALNVSGPNLPPSSRGPLAGEPASPFP